MASLVRRILFSLKLRMCCLVKQARDGISNDAANGAPQRRNEHARSALLSKISRRVCRRFKNHADETVWIARAAILNDPSVSPETHRSVARAKTIAKNRAGRIGENIARAPFGRNWNGGEDERFVRSSGSLLARVRFEVVGSCTRGIRARSNVPFRYFVPR